jgi:hypothetical protein
MKYIITESQYNLIIESEKQIEFFQSMIDKDLESLKQDCDADESIVDICNEVSTIEYIKVKQIEKIKHNSNPKIILKIDIYYEFMKYKSYDDYEYHLKYILRKSTGLPIEIEFDTINTMSNPQW